jgi:long-chain fatty acid transport protein
VDQDIATELAMPAQLVAGVAFQATPSLLLVGDYQFTQWSDFEKIVVDFETAPDMDRYEGFKDTHAFRLGADYVVSDALTLRAGGLTHKAAAPDETVTPLLPEGDRMELTIGGGFKLSKAIELNAAYQYLKQEDREGRVREAAAGQIPTTALNSGTYSFMGHLFGATLTVHF